MKALVRSIDGIVVGLFAVVFPIVADLGWVEAGDGAGISAYATRRDGTAFVPAPAARRVIAPLEFLQRFSPEERAAIRAAAGASAALADWIDQARFAREIDPDAATTIAGLDALVAAASDRPEEDRRARLSIPASRQRTVCHNTMAADRFCGPWRIRRCRPSGRSVRSSFQPSPVTTMPLRVTTISPS